LVLHVELNMKLLIMLVAKDSTGENYTITVGNNSVTKEEVFEAFARKRTISGNRVVTLAFLFK
jgi:hypothetical protein